MDSSEAGTFRAAFTALENKSGSEALRLIAGSSELLLADVVTGLAMGMDDNVFDFRSCTQFLYTHAYWPESYRMAIALQAEKQLGSSGNGGENPQEVMAFFNAYPPQTGDGFVRYVDMLNASHQGKKAIAAIKERWRETNMGEDEQKNFLDHFGSHITAADTFYRLDRLLWDKQYEHAQRLFPMLSASMRGLATARIALSKGSANAPELVDKVQNQLQNDPGLLYERTRWRRKHDDMAGAYALIVKAGNRLGKPEEWWDERNLIIRDLVENHNYAAAYNLAATHGASKGQELSDAEFLAGWIALRFLNNPALAQNHFVRLNANASAPITFARAAYWMGRASEALNQAAQAQGWYARAASFGTTYYGQLAAARLYSTSQISAMAPAISPDAVMLFQNLVITHVVRDLSEIGVKKIAERFALGFAATATQEADFRLMADLALQLAMPDVAVKVAKAAAKKQIALPVEGYPVLSFAQGDILPLVHAITRQESQFDAGISSSSNAQGLMQLLPSTARHVADKDNVPVDPSNLFDAETNVKLGTAYLEELLGNFSGSLPLTIAAYNAGPGRVREWLSKMGDPRGQQLDDIIDWLERIPFNETRNYVQRVMEALQLYRAKLAGGQAVLGIARDIGS